MSENIFKDIRIFQDPIVQEIEAIDENELEESVIEEVAPEIDTTPTDEPEEITEEEAATTDIPLPQIEAASVEEAHLASLVCDSCLELNLISKTCIKCARCDSAFCLHFASTVDAQYCVNCMSDIEVTKQVITKTYEHKNPETQAVTFYRRKARDIQIKGLDWLFAQRKIADLSDMELDLAIEYHRNICNLMIAESERRRTERMHRYAGVKVTIPTPSTTTVSNSTTTTVKKTRTISKNKASEQVAALLKSILASNGGDINSIAALLNKKK